MSKCKNCGYNINLDDNFCKKCGTPADHSQTPACENCGYEYAEGDNFCKKCGKKIDKTIEAPVVNKIETADFDYRKDYDKLYDDSDYPKNKDKRDDKSKDFEKIHYKKEEIKSDKDELIKSEAISEDDLEVPSFFTKSKKTINAMFSDDDHKKTMFSDENKVYDDDLSKDNSVKDKEIKKEENKDHTILLPNLDEYETGSRLEDRAVLSEEKKRLIRESKEKADGINHDLGPTNIEDDEEELTDTQKIRLQAEEERRLENRRVRSSERKKFIKSDEIEQDIPDEKKAKKEIKFSNFLIPILIVVAVISLLFATLSGLTDKKRVIAKFEQSISNDDYDLTSKLVKASDEVTEVNEENIQPFNNLIKNDQIYRSSLLGAIKEDSSKLSIDPEYKSNRPYRLESIGKKFIFFKDYKIIVDPLLLNINDVDGNIFIESTQYSNKIENLKLIPGIYNIKSENSSEIYQINLSPTNEALNNGILTLSLSDLAPIEATENKVEQDIEKKEEEEKTEDTKNTESLAGETELHLDSAHKDAIVYINDESTGLTVEEYNDIPLKSITNGDRIKIGINYPWGMGFSNEINYNGEQLISLFIDPNNSSTMEYIMGRVEKMLKEDAIARRNMNMEGFTTIIEPEISATNEILQNGKSNGMIYYRVYDRINYDPNSFEVIAGENGSYTAYIGGNLVFHATEYPEGSSLDDGYEPYELSEIMGFHLTFLPDRNDWFINSWGYTERYINLEDPIVHEIGE